MAAPAPGLRPLAGHGQRPSPEQRARQGLAPQPVGAKTGTRAYWLERLARDNPALLERLKAGEFRSVREVAVEAGLTYHYITVRADPAVIAAAALTLLDGPQVGALIGYLRHPRTLPASRMTKRWRATREARTGAPTVRAAKPPPEARTAPALPLFRASPDVTAGARRRGEGDRRAVAETGPG